jgi:hypothetical protein
MVFLLFDEFKIASDRSPVPALETAALVAAFEVASGLINFFLFDVFFLLFFFGGASSATVEPPLNSETSRFQPFLGLEFLRPKYPFVTDPTAEVVDLTPETPASSVDNAAAEMSLVAVMIFSSLFYYEKRYLCYD